MATLSELVTQYEREVELIDISLVNLYEKRNELVDEQTEIESYLDGLITDNESLLETLANELVASCPLSGSCSVCTSGGYGVSNLYEWTIVDKDVGEDCSNGGVVYEYTDILNPTEGSTEESLQINAENYAASYDHLKHKINTNGTYGIEAEINGLNDAIGIQEKNKLRLNNLIQVYSGGVSDEDAFFETESVDDAGETTIQTGNLDMDGYDILDAGTINGVTIEGHASRHNSGGADELNHDNLAGFVANEHLDWTSDLGATNINVNNITSLAVTQHEGDINHDSLNNFVANEHIDHSTITISSSGLLNGSGDLTNSFTLGLDNSDINHDLLTNFVANEHIDHSSVSINSGGILSGGGTITSTRTITLNHSDVDHNQTTNTHNLTTDIDHDALTNFVANEHLDWTSDLGATNINDANITSTAVTQHEGSINHDALTNFVANEHINHSSVSINSGGILSGGGDLTTTRTITLNHSDVDHNQTTNTHNLTTDINHSNISGLSNDDHTQYLLADGTRNLSGDLTVDNGASTNVNILCDAGESVLSLYGNSSGAGRVYVGQDNNYGGGIEYTGDSSPLGSGAGSDYITLFRKSAGTLHWTARNLYNSNNWEFRGDIKAVDGTFTGSMGISGDLTIAGTINDSAISSTAVTQHEGSIDHGSISGLSNDDHTQYLLVDGSRAMSGDLSLDSNRLFSVKYMTFLIEGGDKIVLDNSYGQADASAIGIENTEIYYRAEGGHTWYGGSSYPDSGASDIMDLDSLGNLTLQGSLSASAADFNSGDLTNVNSIDFDDVIGDKLLLFSNTYKIGIESGAVAYTTADNHRWYVGSNEIMRLDIGSLTLYGDTPGSATSPDLVFRDGDGNENGRVWADNGVLQLRSSSLATALTINNNASGDLIYMSGDYVGFGNSAPDAAVSIDAVANNTDLINGYYVDSSTMMFRMRQSGNEALFTIFNSSSTAVFNIDANGDAYFQNPGNVGINTITPAAQLDVYGGIRTSRQSTQYLEIVDVDASGAFITAISEEDNKKYLRIENHHDNSGLAAGDLDIIFTIGSSASPYEIFRLEESTQQIRIGESSAIDFQSSATSRDLIYLENHAILQQTSDRGGLYFSSADDSLILASGDNGQTYLSNITETAEQLHLVSDGEVIVATDMQNGYLQRNEWTFDNDDDATLRCPGAVELESKFQMNYNENSESLDFNYVG